MITTLIVAAAIMQCVGDMLPTQAGNMLLQKCRKASYKFTCIGLVIWCKQHTSYGSGGNFPAKYFLSTILNCTILLFGCAGKFPELKIAFCNYQ